MKKLPLLFALCFLSLTTISAQVSTSVVYVTKTYSPNKDFYIQCIPFDNEVPSLKGIARVYNNKDRLVYTINRAFNGIRENGNFIAISNDGQTVTYVLATGAQEKSKELKSVSIYKLGQLAKGFTLTEITGCDPQNNRCRLIYNNFDRIVDTQKSKWGTKEYKKVFKENVAKEEFFLNEHAITIEREHLYITDPDKEVHVLNLKSTSLEPTQSFEEYYKRFKDIPIEELTNYHQILTPYPPDPSYFPNLINGDTTGIALAKYVHRKAVRLSSPDLYKYKMYRINIEAYISRDGTIQLEKLDGDISLPLDSITTFFNSHKYNMSYLPEGLDKWYFKTFYWYFRNPSDAKALEEKQQEEKERALVRERRMTQDTIEGAYIPRNLEECFKELDKSLPAVARNEMKVLKARGDMLIYHLGLGTWIRNRFGLWGGSRLLNTFKIVPNTSGL